MTRHRHPDPGLRRAPRRAQNDDAQPADDPLVDTAANTADPLPATAALLLACYLISFWRSRTPVRPG